MNVRQLKNIMKEVNAPNEFVLEPFDLEHPNFWIFRIKNVRIKTLFSKLESLRREASRFGDPYTIDETDEVKINGDLEEIT